MATSTQTITKHTYDANFGGATQYTSVSGDSGPWSSSTTFGADIASHPMAVAGTFQHFVVTVLGAHPDLTLTLQVNGVSTALSVVISSTATQGSDLVHTAAVVATDSVRLKLDGSSGVGYDIAFGLEFAATTPTESFYAVPAAWGFSAAQWQIGGALGNGTFEKHSGPVVPSNTYSIASTAGTLTRIQITTYAGAPTTNTWTAAVRLNGVTQDGTGGTVNTTCTLTGSGTTAHSTFSLPIAITDHVDVYVTNDYVANPFVPGLGVAVAFTATTPGEFMICGGNNNPFLNDAVGWTWIGVEQEATPEARNSAPVGPTTMTVDGLYVELGSASGVGSSWTTTLRQSGVSQPLTVTIADLATAGSATGSGVAYIAPATIDLQIAPTNTPNGSQKHWGFAVHLTTTPPPTPTGTTYPVRRLRQTPHVSSTQLWQFFSMLQLDLEAGVGLTTGQGSDPQVMLSWSDDGGHTWSAERWVSAGKLGEYRRRAIWWRLGRSRDRVWRIVVSDPVAWRLLQLIVDADPGTS